MGSYSKHHQGEEGSTASLVLKAISHLLDGKPDLLNRILAVVETSTESPMAEVGGPIKMQITASVQRNYQQREVFPQYRPERAAKVLPSLTAVFWVTVDEAEEVLRDAQEQRRKNDGPRGQAKAFTGLVHALEDAIKDEQFQDCVEFPGAEEVDAERCAASAIFKVGTRVSIWDGDEQVGQGSVIGEYRGRLVRCPDGPYVNHGERVEYRYGYTVIQGNETCFYAPHQIAPIGESYGHLRLVR